MKRDIMKRVDALEAGNDNRKSIYVFKWSSWSEEYALAQDDAERIAARQPVRDPSMPVTFLEWRDDHLPEPMTCR